mmetsp:Transcript_36493/g.91470  ORF Transcript_36493/g.91470 Transcript_36493/m.91470 type:complete len:460 (-) Transcript_36493:145-1524(-)|eukprot:CAMPEP_0177655936 /NCGR_PEP_ID=MMETSP0447-20121125/15261_1 /TAXON_ID=0 /ORGANISM="Stygamoeba regulata, Strain BSH-02190019" /LENGTH=459 /DNA_ID=CAMNT_0019159945 /DNA_START=388 /DNA_END=1767 /DNA_ORIENTATION=+
MQKQISVASLTSPSKEGFLTKQGGSIKTWKKRWFVLKGDTLYYFKTQKDQDVTGVIKVDSSTECKLEPQKRKKGAYYFSVNTPNRKYMIHAETEECARQWVEKICAVQQKKQNPGVSHAEPAPARVNTPAPAAAPASESQVESRPPEPRKADGKISPRVQMAVAKGVIGFLQEEDSKVLEFWQIWSESIPPAHELNAGMCIEYNVSTSANMQKLTWRTAGPQNIFIQKMVDFFWNVGAPESEIDRLNDVGALINPIKIGSWIDMSAKGGMDGGWYFPVDIPVKMALEAADAGEPSKKVMEWAEKFTVDKCWSVGRDMGAAPPRQTEMRMKLPGDDFHSQLDIAKEAFSMFGFPALPEKAMEVLEETKPLGLCLSVITSSEGFVRLGLLTPNPSVEAVVRLCGIAGGNNDDLAAFEGSLGSDGPEFAEYQYLNEGFGYGVYKEGFDIVFHYRAGEEDGDD